MKRLLLTVLALAMLSTQAMAFFSSSTSAPTTSKLVQPAHEYEIDTWGSNSEVYEFTPRSNTSYTCVMFMLDSGNAMGLQCFPKSTKQVK